MSAFSGKQGRGAARRLKEVKREEAEARNVAYRVKRDVPITPSTDLSDGTFGRLEVVEPE